MSLSFNDLTSLNGLVQLYKKESGANQGDVSGSTTRLKEFAADTRVAFDNYLHIAFDSSGTWQFDDSNQTNYPIITTNIVVSQRDYAFTTDGSSNLILDIYRVAILPSATATVFKEIEPVDAQSESNSPFVENNTAVTGVPDKYDKTSNGIFLDPIPSYNATGGLKLYINREASHFVYTDTTKKPGVPGNHHSYFYLNPAMDYARRNSLTNYDRIAVEVAKLEQIIIPQTFARRERDVVSRMTPEPIIYE